MQNLWHSDGRYKANHPKIGTSGYSYRDWIPSVYPKGTPPAKFLEAYAQIFSFVEINSSYYRLPGAGFGAAVSARVPAGFRFTMKLPGSLTHGRGFDARGRPNSEARAQLAALSGLLGFDFGSGDGAATALAQRQIASLPAESGAAAGFPALAGLLVQLPFSFGYRPAERYYLAWLLENIKMLVDALPQRQGRGLWVEFRNGHWNTRRVYQGLAAAGAGWTAYDSPADSRLPTLERQLAVAGSTRPEYLRLHGRRTAQWWTGDNSSRYDYCYSAQEISEFAGLLQPLLVEGHMQFVAFNNHPGGHAVRNALEIAKLISTD